MIKSYVDGLKKWKRWDGRTRRRDYWLYQLCNSLVLGAAFTLSIILSELGMTTLAVFSWIATIGYSVLEFIPTLAITVRRLHDTNRGGGMLLVNLIPYVGEIWFFVLMVLPGTVGRNKFGPDPKDVQFSQDDATSYGEYPDFRGN